MIYYDHIKNGAIVAKRQAQNSNYVKNLLGTGNTELLAPAQFEAVGLYVRAQSVLGANQTYTGEVVITDPIGTADAVRELTTEDGLAALEAARIMATLSAWEIRKRLRVRGWLADVEAAVALADPDTQDGWERVQDFERTHPLVIAIATAISKTAADLDDLFGISAGP